MSTPPRPPAVKSYFFGKGYTDLWATIADAWQRNLESASDYGHKGNSLLEEELPGKILAAFCYGAAVSVVVFGSLFTLIVSILHIVILLVFFSVIYLLFSVIAIFERLVMLVRGFFSVCPNCHTRLPLPTYLCDGCGSEHPRLIPSSFGIFYHHCRCGKKLPCTIFTNRGRLKSKCSACDTMLSREHTESRKQFIPIIGGPSVGKSAYLFSLSRHLKEVTAPSLGMSANFIDAHQHQIYESVTESMNKGYPPNKTAETLPKAFDMLFQRKKTNNITLYLYDPAGEAFLDSDQLVPHKFLGYLSGIILLVDPFSFEKMSAHYASSLLNTTGISPSTANVNDILTRLMIAMHRDFGLKSTDKVKIPLAVVINKVDACGLEDIIGEKAVDLYPPKNEKETRGARRNRLIRKVLHDDWNEKHFVSQLETHFSHVEFFTVSALGHSPDGKATRFTQIRVEKPALWILSQSNRVWRDAR